MADKNNTPLSRAEIIGQIAPARRRAEAAHRAGRRAQSVTYDAASRRLHLAFTNDLLVGIPVDLVQALRGATPDQLATVEISPSGAALHFDLLDVDLSVPALLAVAFKGTPASRALGALGGAVRSERKAATSRLNGARGGRPRGKTEDSKSDAKAR